MEKFRCMYWLGALCLALAVTACNPSTPRGPALVLAPTLDGPPTDSVLFSFAFVGCNRIDNKDTGSPYTNASTANVPQLQRTFQEIAGLNPKPTFIFFLGDMVLGLEKDSTVLANQLAAWVAQYQDTAFSPLAGSGIQLVALPGNHEMLFMEKTAAVNKKGKHAKAEMPWQTGINAWMQFMAPFVPNAPLSRVAGPDSLANRATYAFDYQNTHFVVLNTDTWNTDSAIGRFPVAWVNADIAAARARQGTEHIFLLSHKPAYVVPDDGPDDVMDTTMRASLWTAMAAAQAEALLSAHSHQYYRTQPTPQQSYQVVAGNGGSPYVGGLNECGQFMGFSVVYVMKNGDVQLRSFGRDVAASNYLDSISAGLPTTQRDAASLRWGTTSGTWTCGNAGK